MEPEGICDVCLHTYSVGGHPWADLERPRAEKGAPERLLFTPLRFTPLRGD